MPAMEHKCKDKPAAYASWVIFDIKHPDGLFMLPKGKAKTCSEMVNMITKMELQGTYKELSLSGKNRLVFYLDEGMDSDKIKELHGLKWTKHGMSRKQLLAAVAIGVVGAVIGGTGLAVHLKQKRGHGNTLQSPDSTLNYCPRCKVHLDQGAIFCAKCSYRYTDR